MGAPTEVLGHTCAGLAAFQAAAWTVCVPRLTDRGTIAGCDDTNEVPIVWCPWCGTCLQRRTVNVEAQ